MERANNVMRIEDWSIVAAGLAIRSDQQLLLYQLSVVLVGEFLGFPQQQLVEQLVLFARLHRHADQSVVAVTATAVVAVVVTGLGLVVRSQLHLIFRSRYGGGRRDRWRTATD